jgi:hypothetical protein
MADSVTIIVLAGRHSFSGILENRGSRVLDLLNDLSTEFLRLRDITVHRGFCEGIIAQLESGIIPKRTIDVVLLDRGHHEAPMRREHATVKKKSWGAFLVVGDYEIRGKLMLKGSTDVVNAMTCELSAFFPVKDTRLSIVGGDQSPSAAGVALINKAKAALVQIDALPVEQTQSLSLCS